MDIKKMDGVQKVVVFLLILAIVFSIASIAFNFYILDFSPPKMKSSSSAGNSASGIGLIVEGNAPSGGAG